MKMHNPAHPGMLIADILENGGLSIGPSVSGLAKHLGVTKAALSQVIDGKTAVTAQLALRLHDAIGVDAEVWLQMQNKRDLWVASRRRRGTVASLILDEAA